MSVWLLGQTGPNVSMSGRLVLTHKVKHLLTAGKDLIAIVSKLVDSKQLQVADQYPDSKYLGRRSRAG